MYRTFLPSLILTSTCLAAAEPDAPAIGPGVPGTALLAYEMPKPLLTMRLPDIRGSLVRLQQTPYWSIWQSPQFAPLRQRIDDQHAKMLAEDATGIGAQVLEALGRVQALSFGFDFSLNGVHGVRDPEPSLRLLALLPGSDKLLRLIAESEDFNADEIPAPPGFTLAWQDDETVLAASEQTLVVDFRRRAGQGEAEGLIELLPPEPEDPAAELDAQPPAPPARGQAKVAPPAAELLPLADGDAPAPTLAMGTDFQLNLDYGAMLQQIKHLNEAIPEADRAQFEAMQTVLGDLTIDLATEFTSYGMREVFKMSWYTQADPAPGSMAAIMQESLAEYPAADLEVLRGLPAETLWAITYQLDAAQMQKQFDAMPKAIVDSMYGEIDQKLAEAGLQPLHEIITSMNGPLLIYATAPIVAGGFPSITASVPLPPETGQKIIDLIAGQTTVKKLADGAIGGSLMIVPWQLGVVGQELTFTSEPFGLKKHRERQPGFLTHPEVQTALQKVPKDSLVIGLSRSSASWQALVDVGKPLLMATGAPADQIAALDSLPAAAKFGYLGMSRDGTAVSGGTLTMISGMLGLSAGAGAVAWYTFMQRFQGQVPPQQEFNDF